MMRTVVSSALVLVLLAALSGCAQWTTADTPRGWAQGWGDASSPSLPRAPSREYRGAWVASVENIDWPSARGLSANQQRAEIVQALDLAQSLNLNALFVQVRPSCDALYSSSLEPWSEYLSGRQGEAPSPDDSFDPLDEWVRGAHERGIELHAWINPYRARQMNARSELAPGHIARRRPDLVREYAGMLWLDPGEPDAAAHTLAVVDDLVQRYDIDGIHLDDYFYPYPKDNVPFPDDVSYARFTSAGGTLARDDWRRQNVNTLVSNLHQRVKAAKPWVRVSISPFGIWRPGFPSSVRGFDAYANLYADARLWLREGQVDMLIPQLYWKIGAAQQAYPELLNWWRDENTKGRLVIAGNYISRINSTSESWTPSEILNQIARTREASTTLSPGGNVHFSLVALLQNRAGLADALREGSYATAALTPAIPWSASGPRPVRPAVVARDTGKGEVELEITRHRSGEECGASTHPSYVLAERRGWEGQRSEWTTRVVSGSNASVTVPLTSSAGKLTQVAIGVVDRYGRLSSPTIVRVRDEKAVE